MADVLVTHIEKAHAGSQREVIVALGNPNTPQGGWRWNSSQVIASLAAGTNTFFVRDPESGKRYDVVVLADSEGAEGRLAAFGDDNTVDHLCSLNEFPSVMS